jgi:hypothetical protein
MGRGRTTTAQIAAALVVGILGSDGTQEPLPRTPLSAKHATVSRVGWDAEAENIYLDGEYKAILQLVGVLRYGKQAKRLADQAIDAMEGVQNLRKAIYDYKCTFSLAR